MNYQLTGCECVCVCCMFLLAFNSHDFTWFNRKWWIQCGKNTIHSLVKRKKNTLSHSSGAMNACWKMNENLNRNSSQKQHETASAAACAILNNNAHCVCSAASTPDTSQITSLHRTHIRRCSFLRLWHFMKSSYSLLIEQQIYINTKKKRHYFFSKKVEDVAFFSLLLGFCVFKCREWQTNKEKTYTSKTYSKQHHLANTLLLNPFRLILKWYS